MYFLLLYVLGKVLEQVCLLVTLDRGLVRQLGSPQRVGTVADKHVEVLDVLDAVSKGPSFFFFFFPFKINIFLEGGFAYSASLTL